MIPGIDYWAGIHVLGTLALIVVVAVALMLTAWGIIRSRYR